jgi:membrane protease YdiL (CAAX protease family)
MRTIITSDIAPDYLGRIRNVISVSPVTRKRIIVLTSPPILIAFMYPVFHLLAGALVNDRIAWYLGLAIYWLVWGAIFPISIIGKDKIRALIHPGKPNRVIILPISIIVVGALASRLFVPGMGYEKESVWILLLLISTSLGNGFFEEVLWRGVYVTLFPDRVLLRMILPSIWFGAWHYVPGSVFHDSIIGLTGLMAGSMMMGLVLSYMTKRTNTLWWSILAHTIGGIIMVI